MMPATKSWLKTLSNKNKTLRLLANAWHSLELCQTKNKAQNRYQLMTIWAKQPKKALNKARWLIKKQWVDVLRRCCDSHTAWRLPYCDGLKNRDESRLRKVVDCVQRKQEQGQFDKSWQGWKSCCQGKWGLWTSSLLKLGYCGRILVITPNFSWWRSWPGGKN